MSKKYSIRRSIKRKLAIIAMLISLIGVAGTTLAFLMDSTDEITNTFVPAHVDSHVNDDYTVTNKGDIPAYLRASVTFNWVVDDSAATNNTVYYVKGATLPEIKTLRSSLLSCRSPSPAFSFPSALGSLDPVLRMMALIRAFTSRILKGLVM